MAAKSPSTFLLWLLRLQILSFCLLLESYRDPVKNELMPSSEEGKCLGLFISLKVPVISIFQSPIGKILKNLSPLAQIIEFIIN